VRCSGRKEGQPLWRHAHSAFGKTLDGQRRGAHIGAAVSRAWLEAISAGSPTGGAWQARPRGRSSGGHSDSRPSSAWDARVSRGSVGDWALPQKEAERVGAEAGTGREGTRPHGAGQGRGSGHHSCCSGKRAQCVHASLHWTASGAKHRSRVSPTIAHDSASSARAERAATARYGRDGSWRAVVLSRSARAPRHPLLQIVAACACARMRSSASPQRFEFGWQQRQRQRQRARVGGGVASRYRRYRAE
jgi:hypothetical protein